MYVAGDWHCNIFEAVKILEEVDENSTFFHTGDFSLYPKNKTFLKACSDIAQEKNIKLIIVMGNHDNYDWVETLDDTRVFGQTHGWFKRWGNLIICPHYARVDVEGISVGLFAGAGSVHRLDDNWWVQETRSLEEFEEAKKAGVVDLAVTHDSSGETLGFKKKWPQEELSGFYKLDEKRIGKILGNRNNIKNLLNAWEVKLHVHGHYHKLHVETNPVNMRTHIGLGQAAEEGNLVKIDGLDNWEVF